MFLSEPFKYYNNSAFLVKMVFLAAAAIYHFTVHRAVVSGRWRIPWAAGKLEACLSLGLWFMIGAAGRAIGFV